MRMVSKRVSNDLSYESNAKFVNSKLNKKITCIIMEVPDKGANELTSQGTSASGNGNTS